MQIILGSSSERRKYILNFFSLPFKQVDSNFDESSISQELPPDKYTCEIARQKALAVSSAYPKEIILTADTVVYFQNKYLLKPKDEKEAFSMLQDLSGSTHEVYTGVCVKTENDIFVKSENAKIVFNKLSDDEIKKYHKNFFFADKAGGYGIQNGGTILVKKIEGCFYNVMGLPINTLRELLKKAGIDLWDFLKPL